MVKMKLEVAENKWMLIETISLTPKTNEDFKKRIPQNTLLWRPIYLNKIIKEPKISMEDWGNIPVTFINTIYNCIHDILTKYSAASVTLNIVLNEIDTCELEDYKRFNNLVSTRDKILNEIDEIENNTKTFEFSMKEIKKINRNALSSINL